MSFFFFYKTREQKGQIYSVWGVDTSGRGEDIRKGCIWGKYCVQVYVNEKMRPVETIPGMGGEA
jgi:hypothetical protein